MSATIVLLPGDGIGPEVVAAARRVLEITAGLFGRSLVFDERLIGGAALDRGLPALPDDTLAACQTAEAILLGAVGDPKYDAAPRGQKPETALLGLRKALGAYANLRPAAVWPGLEDSGPFKPDRIRGTNMLIVRELTGGLYFGEPRSLDVEAGVAVNTLCYTAVEVERIAAVAFEAARTRRRVVTSVDKANVLETSQLWRAVVDRVALHYPDVRHEHMYVDACAMAIALDPRRFDVVLTENLFGDILSDEAGAVAGSLGLLPSASLGRGPGLYEPVHGSAPTLAGKDLANPIGAIASAAMLLRHSLGIEDAARAVERAIGEALEGGLRTADLATGDETPVSCRAMTEAIARRLRV